MVNDSLLAEFDLEKEKSGLDEQGLRIAENQENSQKNRRKLAESTRGCCSCHLLLFLHFFPLKISLLMFFIFKII